MDYKLQNYKISLIYGSMPSQLPTGAVGKEVGITIHFCYEADSHYKEYLW